MIIGTQKFDLVTYWLTNEKRGHRIKGVLFFRSCVVPQSARRTYLLQLQLPQIKNLNQTMLCTLSPCAMGSKHCLVVSRGDLARRGKFPYRLTFWNLHRHSMLNLIRTRIGLLSLVFFFQDQHLRIFSLCDIINMLK